MKTQIFLFLTAMIFSIQFMGNHNFAATNENTGALVSSNIYYEAEEELVIEDWMTNDVLWGITSEKEFEIDSKVVEEEELAIEDWMTDDDLWRL